MNVKDTTMAANQDFQYDVFPSHSAKDEAVVRPLAERLRADRLKVRFDEGAVFDYRSADSGIRTNRRWLQP